MNGEDVAPRARAREEANALVSVGAAVYLVAAVFVSRAIAGLYGGLGREVPAALALLCPLCVSLSALGWFWAYSRQYRIPLGRRHGVVCAGGVVHRPAVLCVEARGKARFRSVGPLLYVLRRRMGHEHGVESVARGRGSRKVGRSSDRWPAHKSHRQLCQHPRLCADRAPLVGRWY